MSISDLFDKYPNEDSAYQFFYKAFWRYSGPECPYCQSRRHYVRADPKRFICADCRKSYSLRTHNFFENSKVPYRIWLYALYFFVTTNGISSPQLAGFLGVTQKTAWFMLQRIRMSCSNPYYIKPLRDVVEVDETYIGGLEKNKHAKKKLRSGRGAVGKFIIVSIWKRNKTGKGKGTVCSFTVPNVTKKTLHATVRNFVRKGSKIFTDEHKSYIGLSEDYTHETVNHSQGEYVRDDAHTNGVESSFNRLNSVFYGTHRFFTKKHAFGYAAEMSFRQNIRATNRNTSESIRALLLRGKRIRVTYKQLKQKIVQCHVYPTKLELAVLPNMPREILRNRRNLRNNPFTPDELYSNPIKYDNPKPPPPEYPDFCPMQQFIPIKIMS